MRALVYGDKISGKGATKLLLSQGYSTSYIDDNSDIKVLDDVDLMVLSPAIRLDNPLVCEARSRGIEVIGEIELGYRYNKGTIIALTGTNGKTTTAMMIDNMVSASHTRHHLLGNIGTSFAGAVDRVAEGDIVTLEVSSYQLEGIERFRPHIGLLLNITLDHIERHGTFEDYAKTKADIFCNMTSEDYAVLNADDDVVMSFDGGIKANKYYFSTRERVKGAYVKDKYVYYLDERLFSIKDTHIVGEHNVKNMLATVVVGKIMGISNAVILRSLRGFSLPPHRIQYIGKYKNKRYYNDSKATNIDATISAVKSMRGYTTLIVGGYDKGISYRRLFEALDKNIRSVIIFGQNRHKVEECIKEFDIRYYVVPSLLKAIERAKAERVENVLFSPATSSYDMFKNYEERGDMFIKLVGDINED